MTRKYNERDQIRRRNRSVILHELRRNGPQARIDLGQATALSPATVTAITSDLLQEGLIEGFASEESCANVTRGRPRSLLRITSEASYVISVRIALNSVELTLADYAGEKRPPKWVYFDSSKADHDNFPPILVEAIRTFINEQDIDSARVSEIGIAAQGVVELSTGRVVWSPAFSCRNIPIVEPLTEAFGVHCHLTNDTNMITEALRWQDPETYSGTFAVIMLDYGVGMGLYLHDQLFAGANGSAGELGHSNHIPGGARCLCGKRGCFEAYLADYALLRDFKCLPDDTDPNDIISSAETLDMLFAKAESGDEQALKVLKNAGRALGFGIARILAILDISRIVLTGHTVRAYEFMKASMEEGLQDALVEDLRQNLIVDVMPWNADFVHSGLVAKAMERLDHAGRDVPAAQSQKAEK